MSHSDFQAHGEAIPHLQRHIHHAGQDFPLPDERGHTVQVKEYRLAVPQTRQLHGRVPDYLQAAGHDGISE